MSCCCCGGVIGPRNADVIKPLSSPTLFVLSLLQSEQEQDNGQGSEGGQFRNEFHRVRR